MEQLLLRNEKNLSFIIRILNIDQIYIKRRRNILSANKEKKKKV